MGVSPQLAAVRMAQRIAHIIRKLVDIQHHLAPMDIAHDGDRQNEVTAVFGSDEQFVSTIADIANGTHAYLAIA